jgi:hypothetical protein
MQLHIQPSEIDQTTWNEYLNTIIGQMELNGAKVNEPISPRELQRRMKAQQQLP